MLDSKKFTLDDLGRGTRIYFIGIGGISIIPVRGQKTSRRKALRSTAGKWLRT